MERLLKDAEKLPAAMGRKFDISNYADVVEAIHLIQENMGIAGATALEAGTTIEGSVNSMKAAWSNLVTDLANGNADIGKSVDNLVTTIVGDGTANNLGVLGNVMPAVERVLDGVTKLIKKGVPAIMKTIPKLLEKNLPILIEAAVSSFESILESVEENKESLFQTVFNLIQYLSKSFFELLPRLLKIGLELIVTIAKGISENFDSLIQPVTGVIFEIIKILTDEQMLSKLLEAAFGIVSALALHLMSEDVLNSLIDACVSIVTTISTILIDNIDKMSDVAIEIIDALATYLTDPENLKKIISAGVKITKSLINGLVSMQNPLNEASGNLADSVVSKFTGIDLSDTGKKVAGSFISSLISEMTRGLSVNNPLGKFVLDKIISGSFNSFVDGSHRNGLDYVPYDGYIAELHQGEKVLTASEASGYSAGNSFGDIIINIDGAKYSDEQSLASAIALEIQNMTDRRAAVYA